MTTIKLTELEQTTLWKVAETVNSNMAFDTKNNEYNEDHENFLLCLSVKEKKALSRIIKKL